MPTYSVIIIGSGFGGQCAAINLLKRGISDFLILERRDFMGGTWCQNSYPGAAVDVQSPLYSISSEPYRWSQMFAAQEELEAYTNHVIDKHGLREKTLLNANVVGVAWDDSEHVWQVATEAGGTFAARILVNASGPLSTPVIPDFPGRHQFAGAGFHTNGWDHSMDLTGKKVAVIGSGASAAQVIPAIAPDVAELHVFQRTPHWVLPRPDRRFNRMQRRLLGIPWIYRMLRVLIYWSLESRVVGFKYSQRALNFSARRKALRLLERQVPDPELRAKLTPDYTIGCKRIILSNTLYPALAGKNATLYTRDEGIAEINEHGILTRDGRQVDLDAIIYSTGYDATDGVISYPVVGRDGRTLAEAWAEFPRAYLGTTIPGFPNLFIVTGPNTGIGHTSAIFVIEAQMRYLVNALHEMDEQGATALEVCPEAEDRYTTMIHREMERTVWKSGGCHSWYQSKSGHVIAMFPGFTFTYRRLAGSFKREHHILRQVEETGR
ncbi:MAG TPA: NAD(P)/FAD-dependent oxidoreductase [Flexivirga sp.]|uniref:flavin-containing monooxygenase n=1 Tax=Flexivirga sp. TaxID=1962927 RepID=UPI002CD98F4E|nr:NAD(P)/FAD-dependent oxidoreductase [Flexivirga sp.]HWC21250.1 NAD(P)/FAD-dependent oxidoreductase [Flexivirga sp.]